MGDDFSETVEAETAEQACETAAKQAGYRSVAGLKAWSLENHGEEWELTATRAD